MMKKIFILCIRCTAAAVLYVYVYYVFVHVVVANVNVVLHIGRDWRRFMLYENDFR